MSEEGLRGGEAAGAPDPADVQAVRELRRALTLAATVGTVVAAVPRSRLLEMIVRTAAHVLSARAGTLFLLDEEAQELTFEVATGPNAAEAKKFRVPLG